MPGAQFQIVAITKWAFGITEVQLCQVASVNFETGTMEPSPYATIPPEYSHIDDYMMPNSTSSAAYATALSQSHTFLS
eukprot:gene32792-biopygen26570